MPTKVSLRQTQANRLSIQQADESLEHLSQLEAISADQQLYTGGDYASTGDRILNLPEDGNKFSIYLQDGEVTFTGGTIEGESDVTIYGEGRRTFAKIDGDWRLIGSVGGGGGSAYTSTSQSVTLSPTENWVWADSKNNPIILSIPIGQPADTTWFIHRHGASTVTVDPSGTEGIIDPATNQADQSGVVINEDGATIAIKKTGSNYELAVIHNP